MCVNVSSDWSILRSFLFSEQSFLHMLWWQADSRKDTSKQVGTHWVFTKLDNVKCVKESLETLKVHSVELWSPKQTEEAQSWMRQSTCHLESREPRMDNKTTTDKCISSKVETLHRAIRKRKLTAVRPAFWMSPNCLRASAVVTTSSPPQWKNKLLLWIILRKE